MYFALVNYTTLGYGDVTPMARWRLLGPMTAMDGVLLFGWSTAVIFQVLRRREGASWVRVSAPAMINSFVRGSESVARGQEELWSNRESLSPNIRACRQFQLAILNVYSVTSTHFCFYPLATAPNR